MKEGFHYPVIVGGCSPGQWYCAAVIRPGFIWIVQSWGAQYHVTRDTCTCMTVGVFGLKRPWCFNFVKEARQGALKLLTIVKKHPNWKIPYDVWKIIARYVKGSTGDWRWIK